MLQGQPLPVTPGLTRGLPNPNGSGQAGGGRPRVKPGVTGVAFARTTKTRNPTKEAYMREIIISPNQAGQRLDKFCLRELGRPSKVFVHF